MGNKKMVWLVAGLGVLILGLTVFAFIPLFGGGSKKPAEESVTAELPDGEVQKMSDSKSEAFRGRVSTEEYFDQLGALLDEEEVSLVSEEIRRSESANDGVTAPDEAGSVSRVFGVPDSPAPASSSRAVSGGGVPRSMTELERLEYDRRRAEMVRDVLAGGASDSVGGNETESTAKEEPRTIDLSALGSSDGIITTLDDEPDDAAVQYEGAKRPFRCMFVRDQKLTSGQRVTLRLLEDVVQDGVRIPANTHLAAICKIGDRLELQVRSLEMNGRIIPLALDAYDTDGLQGIYCPETASVKASRQASQDAISTAGTTFGGLVGDLASTVIRTGATIARSASGELSVSVVSGYEFYLVKAERR